MTLNLIRLPLSISDLALWAEDRGWTHGRGQVLVFDEGRALHHLIDEVWGSGVVRPFRLLVPPRRPSGFLYGYCGMDAKALQDVATVCAGPEHLRVLAVDKLESKAMPKTWEAGKRLGFDLRVRPVRRLRRALDDPSLKRPLGIGAELDAFLLEALRCHASDPKGMAQRKRTREAVYLEWLDDRFAAAATLDLDASRLARFRRSRISRGNSSLEGPDATIHGTLTVSDPVAFASLLVCGVGRHRAYGYGMLLLRPPNRPVPKR